MVSPNLYHPKASVWDCRGGSEEARYYEARKGALPGPRETDKPS